MNQFPAFKPDFCRPPCLAIVACGPQGRGDALIP
jgi:hypothetical protein